MFAKTKDTVASDEDVCAAGLLNLEILIHDVELLPVAKQPFHTDELNVSICNDPDALLRAIQVVAFCFITNAFSRKFENFQAAVSLNFAYYNLCKTNGSIRCTPAMAAGVEKSQWTVAELVERCGE